jgi:hypothetical protein
MCFVPRKAQLASGFMHLHRSAATPNARTRTISIAKPDLYTNISIKSKGETHAEACDQETRRQVADLVAAP